MTEKKKRTYRLDSATVQVIEYMAENTHLNKQESIDRMVKYYARKLKKGELDDKVIVDAIDDDADAMFEDEGGESSRSFVDKLRGKD